MSAFSTEPGLRPHTRDEAAAVVALAERYHALSLELLGRRSVFASDEFYLVAGEDPPGPDALRQPRPGRERRGHGRALHPRLRRARVERGAGHRLLPERRRRAGLGVPRAARGRRAGAGPRPGGDPHRRVRRADPLAPGGARRLPRRRGRRRGEQVLRREHQGGRPAHRRRPRPRARRRGRGRHLPRPRRLPQRGALPRRHGAGRPAARAHPGAHDRSGPARHPRRARARDPAPGRDRRPAQRRQVGPGQPPGRAARRRSSRRPAG